jgi:hypothetical protein
MELRTWILAEHTAVCDRLRGQVLSRVPRSRWDERPGEEGASIAWVLWHTLRHQDVALNAVVRGVDQVVTRDGWLERVGAAALPSPATGLSEADDRASSKALDPDLLDGYAEAVWAETASWLASAPLDYLEGVPDAASGLRRAGVPEDEYSWLYRMWDGKPTSFHVSWEAIGHGFNHLGEMVHIRNRLGIAGF